MTPSVFRVRRAACMQFACKIHDMFLDGYFSIFHCYQLLLLRSQLEYPLHTTQTTECLSAHTHLTYVYTHTHVHIYIRLRTYPYIHAHTEHSNTSRVSSLPVFTYSSFTFIFKTFKMLFIVHYNQQMHKYFTNYHTPTCFDTIVSSSGSL
jgi:hypothetical protein